MSVRSAAPLLATFLLACDPGAGEPPDTVGGSPETGACPKCECDCEGDGSKAEEESGGRGPIVQVAIDPSNDDRGELVASASRKMMHGDGAGCLADLDAVAKLDPKFEARLAVSRGQCEMLVGKCQGGKARVSAWYQHEMAMTKQRADLTAESLGSMRCRDGDSTDRDRFLAAHFDLTDGAYMNKRDSAYCKARIEILRELLPKVPANGPDDAQITGAGQALFHTAAQCYGRAGDCKSAYAIYAELFPVGGMGSLSQKQQNSTIRESFESTILHCAKPKRP